MTDSMDAQILSLRNLWTGLAITALGTVDAFR